MILAIQRSCFPGSFSVPQGVRGSCLQAFLCQWSLETSLTKTWNFLNKTWHSWKATSKSICLPDCFVLLQTQILGTRKQMDEGWSHTQLPYEKLAGSHLYFLARNPGLWQGLTTESFLKLVGQLLYNTVALHIVHMIILGLASNLPQCVHVHPANPDGKDLDASCSGPCWHILHSILGTSIGHNDRHLCKGGQRQGVCFNGC